MAFKSACGPRTPPLRGPGGDSGTPGPPGWSVLGPRGQRGPPGPPAPPVWSVLGPGLR